MPEIKKDNDSSFYRDMLPALIFPLAVAVHYYSFRALLICLVSVAAAVLSEIIGCGVIRQKNKLNDLGSVYTGILLSLMMPAGVRLWIPVMGSIFAVLFVKIPFGGIESSPFSCTAAAFSFLCICKGSELFAYPVLKNEGGTEVFGSENFVQGTSAAQSLLQNKTHGVTAVEIINSFIGTVPGAMGGTAAVVFLGLMLYLLFRRPKNFINAVSFAVTCFVGCVITVAADCGNIFSQNSLRMICIRFFSGFTLLIAVFLITEEPQSPKKAVHRVIYGALAAAGYMLLRRFSVFEDGGCFAVLGINAIWPAAEKYLFSPRKKKAEVKAIE